MKGVPSAFIDEHVSVIVILTEPPLQRLDVRERSQIVAGSCPKYRCRSAGVTFPECQ